MVQIVEADAMSKSVPHFLPHEEEIFNFYAPPGDDGDRDPDIKNMMLMLARPQLYTPGDPLLHEVYQDQCAAITQRIIEIHMAVVVDKFMIGFLLTIVEGRPEIYQSFNYATFESWLSSLSISRKMIAEVRMSAMVWPFMRRCGYDLVTFLNEFSDPDKVKLLYNMKRGIESQIEAQKKDILAERHPDIPEARIPLADRHAISLQAQEECIEQVKEQINLVRVLSTQDYIEQMNRKVGKPEPLHILLRAQWREGALYWQEGQAECGIQHVAGLEKGIVIVEFLGEDGVKRTAHEQGGMLIHLVDIPDTNLGVDPDDD
jgi:hypothetical protein